MKMKNPLDGFSKVEELNYLANAVLSASGGALAILKQKGREGTDTYQKIEELLNEARAFLNDTFPALAYDAMDRHTEVFDGKYKLLLKLRNEI